MRTRLLAAAAALLLAESARAAEPPYPPSPVIAGIEWAPADEIVRLAPGGDNWPLTWGDDDALYTAYGDGRGFRPFVPRKLSVGLARVHGNPPEIRGENLRAMGVERTGDGAKGEKASGMLMVDGVLYLLVRNAGNARLAWSSDHGRTWQRADWTFAESFGCPMFLNFGRNYAGARDGFVYVYSHDADSAYEPADRMVLARAPKDRLTERAAYEFFAGLDEDGGPTWSRDIERRAAVFAHRGRCYRSGITYNAALKRYLWCQIIPGGETRFRGGFGIYDAPEPWGPWTTAFFTEAWDVGPGETSSFPSKWISDNGRTLHLVFSGGDAFSVRRATLRLKDDDKLSGGIGVSSVPFSGGTDLQVCADLCADPMAPSLSRPGGLDHQRATPPVPRDGAAEPIYPGKEWQRAEPAGVGLDAAELHKARDYALSGGGSGCVIHQGRLVLSWGDPAKLYDLKSTTKSIGVTALGLAIQDEKVRLDDLAVKHHPKFGTPPESNAATGWLGDITLTHLATQTAGFEKPGGYGKLLFKPGSQWHYSDAGPNWLAECLTLAYRRDMRDLLFERVFTPVGITGRDLTWRKNSYRPHEIDGIPRREFGSGVSANVDAMARLGYLYLREGRWQDRQLLPKSFIDTARQPLPKFKDVPEHDPEQYDDASAHYGLLWWNNADGTLKNVPRDAYWSWGLYDSLIVVIPSRDLVAVRAGRSWPRKSPAHYEVLRPFLEPLARAAK
jgi:CubicO group peptidase (beta-lactamase class C family)